MRRVVWVGMLAAIVTVCLLAPGVAAQTKTLPKKQAADGKAPASAPYPPGLLKPETLIARAPEVFHVKFVTTKGEFTVKVTRAWSPNGADRFFNLVRNRFYDGAHFFRVLNSPRPFVVQFGISAHPVVSKAWTEARIQDDPVIQSNTRGFITFATSGPNSRTTQVFINLGDNSRLNSMGFSPFGEVTQGMEVVDQLYGEYGEGAPRGNGPRQDLIQSQGKAYLDKEFPNLDSIKTARILASAAPGQPAKRPAKQP